MKSTQQTPKVPLNKPAHQFYSDSVALDLKNQDSSLDDIIKAQDIESSGKEPDITDNDLNSEIKKIVSKVNEKLPNYKHIKNFKLLKEPLEKTTTQKIKRFGNNLSM